MSKSASSSSSTASIYAAAPTPPARSFHSCCVNAAWSLINSEIASDRVNFRSLLVSGRKKFCLVCEKCFF